MDQQDVMRFVGVTGLPGAGKGVFIELLRPRLAEKGVETRYYSLSDELRAEARGRGQAVERPVLRRIANELRRDEGAGVLSLLVVKKLRSDLQSLPESTRLVVIIDAIRNPQEVRALRRELGEQFVLTAVEAPLEVLVERIAARARFDEPAEIVKQKEAARQMILGESGENEPVHGHNIAQCVEMADWRIDNSRSLDALSEAIGDFINAKIVRAAPADEKRGGHKKQEGT